MPYILFSLMILFLIMLIYSIYKKRKLSIYFKTGASIFFISTAISCYFKLPAGVSYSIFIIIGLCCSLCGDVALALFNLNDHKSYIPFIAGLCSFSLTHIFYSIAFCQLSPIKPLDIFMFTVLAAVGIAFLRRCSVLDFKGYFKPVSIYVVLVTFMTLKALSVNTLISSNFYGVVLITCGALLFYISDLILCFIYFDEEHKSYLSALNLIAYYVGQGLLALSIMFI